VAVLSACTWLATPTYCQVWLRKRRQALIAREMTVPANEFSEFCEGLGQASRVPSCAWPSTQVDGHAQAQAQAQITQLEESIAQTENQISILLGRNPGDISRGLSLVDQPHMPDVPVGLPSALLERRPDVREAEEALATANANVGVAKAAYFPQIPLTASFGASSTSLLSCLNGPAAAWSIAGQAL